MGYSDSARDMRLRLRFDDRELVVDEHPECITIGRAEENDVVVTGHLSSRLHAWIVIGRSNFVLIDKSTNGTFVQTDDGEEFFIRQDILQLKGRGMIGLGSVPEQGSEHTIHFTCVRESDMNAVVTHLPSAGSSQQQRDSCKPSRRNNPPENRVTLQLALRTLSGIRKRFEMERAAHPDTHARRVHVALDDSDLRWIAATIEALEEPAAAGTSEATGRIAQSSFRSVH
jgi:hypothetical protein